MKKKLLILLVACVSLTVTLSSCLLLPGTSSQKPEGFIFDKSSDITIVFADETLPDELTNKLYDAVREARGGNAPDFGSASLDVSDHEIVVGRSDRPVSVAAYTRLEQLDDENGDNARYVIYSDGSSVAIAYDSDTYNIAAESALELFISEYIEDKESLVMKAGSAKEESFSIYEYWDDRDEEYANAQWAALEEHLGDSGEEIVSALKVLYSNFDHDMIEWLAGLYAPRSCVCENYDDEGNKVCLYPKDENGEYLCSGGGFYYSVSALENNGFLPDIESTAQAISIISGSGMARVTKGAYASLPQWMKNEIIAFLQPMQDPVSGFFYHPQWGSDVNSPRRTRDLNNAVSMLNSLGGKIWYRTPTGVGGNLSDDELSSYSFATGRLGEGSVVSLVSKVITTSNIVLSSPWLESDVTFRAYLRGEYGHNMDLSTRSYSIGQEMTTQKNIIIQRDKELAEEGADYRLMDILIDWFNEHQDPTTGHWHAAGTNYDAINGVLKITGVYSGAKANIPNADVLARSCIQIINNDVEPTSIVHLYNPWGALKNVIGIIENYAPEVDENGLTREERVASILEDIYSIAPEAILKTSERVAKFRKADGGFSYGIQYSSATSQGESAAVPHSPEGDINGTMLATTGLVGNLLGALKLSAFKVNFYGHADLLEFLNIIEEASPVLKQPINNLEVPDTKTFDDDEINGEPTDVSVNISSVRGEGYVVKDPRPGVSGNVLYFNSPDDRATLGGNGKSDAITIANPNKNIKNATCFVFEADLCLIGDKTPLDAGYTTQIEIGSAYCITVRIIDGNVHVWESSSKSDGKSRKRELAVFSLDQWFNVRVEYYLGDNDTVRIKTYIDKKLVCVSDNYFDDNGNKLSGSGTPSKTYNSAIIRVISSTTTGMYIDNVNAYSSNDVYQKPESSEGLIFNIDAPAEPEKEYTFDETPGDIEFSGDYEISKGVLDLFTSNSPISAKIPVNLRDVKGNAVEIITDITVNSASLGKIASIVLHEGGSDGASCVSVTYNLIVEQEGGNKYLTVEVATSTSSEKLVGVNIPIGEESTLKIIYFRDEPSSLVYVDGALVGASIKHEGKAKLYTTTQVTFSTNASVSSDITLDNLVVQRRNIDFATATKPTGDRVTNDFESGLGDISSSGAQIVENGGNKLLEVDASDNITLEVNQLGSYAPTIVFSAKLTVNSGIDATSHRIVFVDENGETVYAIDIEILGSNAVLREHVDGRSLKSSVGSFKLDREVEISIEYYFDFKEIQVFIDGTVSGVSTSLSEAGINGSSIAEVEIYGLNNDTGSIYLDDVVFESWNKLHENRTVNAENEEDDSSVLTFETSNAGNMPKAITSSLNSTGAALNVKQVLDKNNEYTTALEYVSRNGAIDSLLVGLTESNTQSVMSVFEADFKITSNGTANLYQLFFESGTASANRAYMLQLTKSGGSVYMQDMSHNDASSTDGSGRYSGQKVKIASLGEWFNIKVEIWNGNKDTVRIKTYVNGELVYVSDNYFMSHRGTVPYTAINTVRINTLLASDTVMIVDNVSFMQKTATDAIYRDDDDMLVSVKK